MYILINLVECDDTLSTWFLCRMYRDSLEEPETHQEPHRILELLKDNWKYSLFSFMKKGRRKGRGVETTQGEARKGIPSLGQVFQKGRTGSKVLVLAKLMCSYPTYYL